MRTLDDLAKDVAAAKHAPFGTYRAFPVPVLTPEQSLKLDEADATFHAAVAHCFLHQIPLAYQGAVRLLQHFAAVVVPMAATTMEDRVVRQANYPDVSDAEWAIVKRQHPHLYEEWLRTARRHIRAMREPTQEQYDALCATDKMWRELNSEVVWKTYIDAASPEPRT